MTSDHNRKSRRDWLKGVAILGPVSAFSGSALAVERTSDPISDVSSSAPEPAQPAVVDYKPTFFTPAEWDFINAACARLIPQDEHGPGAVEVGVPQYIDRQLGTPWADGAIWYMHGPFFQAAPEFGYQSKLTPKQQYRMGIAALDKLCRDQLRAPFAQLTPDQQDTVLKKIESGKLTSPDLPLKTFFTSFLLKNTLEGFFCDPMYGGNKDMAGWKMIGHPGARADFLEWVGDPKPYPYGPVSIHGEQG